MKIVFGKYYKPKNDDDSKEVMYLLDIYSFYRYSYELDNYKKNIDRSKEKEYIECYKATKDEKCLYHIVMCNQDMIISIASQMCKDKYQMMDYIQEGNIGLLKALEKYDTKFGVKFYTYAAIYVKSEMLRYEEIDDIISNTTYIKYKKTIKKLTNYLNSFKSVYELPSYNEIKAKLKIDTQILNKCIPVLNDIILHSLTEKKVYFNPNYIMERVFPKRVKYISMDNLEHVVKDFDKELNKFEYNIAEKDDNQYNDSCYDLSKIIKKIIHKTLMKELLDRKITIQEYEHVNRNLDGFFDCICNEQNKENVNNNYVLKYIRKRPLLRSKIYSFLKKHVNGI